MVFHSAGAGDRISFPCHKSFNRKFILVLCNREALSSLLSGYHIVLGALLQGYCGRRYDEIDTKSLTNKNHELSTFPPIPIQTGAANSYIALI